MKIERSIRVMSREELHAKRDWGTSGCQVEGCAARAAYLVLEASGGAAGEWWQYCCTRHARQFAGRHDLRMPVEALHLPIESPQEPDPHKPAA